VTDNDRRKLAKAVASNNDRRELAKAIDDFTDDTRQAIDQLARRCDPAMPAELYDDLTGLYDDLNALEEKTWRSVVEIRSQLDELPEVHRALLVAMSTWPEEEAARFFAEWETAAKAGTTSEFRKRWEPALLASLDDDDDEDDSDCRPCGQEGGGK
jgi:hypothetical protein